MHTRGQLCVCAGGVASCVHAQEPVCAGLPPREAYGRLARSQRRSQAGLARRRVRGGVHARRSSRARLLLHNNGLSACRRVPTQCRDALQTLRPKPPWITAKPIGARKFEAVEKAGKRTAARRPRRASHRRLQQKGQAGSAAQASRPTVPLPACAVLSRPQSTAATPSAALGRRRGGEAGCRGGSTSTPRPQRCAALDGTLTPSRARVRMRVLRLSARQHVRGRR